MNSFWIGFSKRAEALVGGSGHTGMGKGVLLGNLQFDRHDSTEEAFGRADKEDTRTDKSLLDRNRTARDFGVGRSGPEFQDESIPHIRY